MDRFKLFGCTHGAISACIFVIGIWAEHKSAIPFVHGPNGSLAGFIAYPKPPIGNWRQPQSADADALIEGLAYIQPCGIAVFIASAVAVAWKTIGLVKQ